MGGGESRYPVVPIVLRAAVAIGGVAIALALVPAISRPARPDQLPGILRTLNINTRTPFLVLAMVVAFPIIANFLLQPLLRLPEREDTSASFRGADLILLPAFAAVMIAIFDLTHLQFQNAIIVAAVIVLAMRMAVRSAYCFALAPLALVPECSFFAGNRSHAGWPALLIAIATPFAMRALVRDTPRMRVWIRRSIAFVIFPIAAYAYGTATSLDQGEGKPRADLFETSHMVVPGVEMLAGKQMYRDIVPAHGLISDGLLAYVALRRGPMTIGHEETVRRALERLMRPAEYFVALAITGSPEVSILAFFLGEVLGTSIAPLRAVPAMFALAFATAAVRLRRPSLLAAAGVLVVIALLTGTDFGTYAVITAVAAALLIRGARLRAFAFLAAGAIGCAVAAIIVLGRQMLLDLASFTFSMTAPLADAYTLPPIAWPATFDRSAFLFALWLAIVIGFAMSVGTRARNELRLVAIFTIVCGVSYAERHHAYFQYAMAPLIAGAIFFVFRRWVVPIALAVAVLIGEPTTHLRVTAAVRRSRGAMDAGWREVAGDRTRGAYFDLADGGVIDTSRAYLETHLRPGETFFDFTNRGALYFLLDRRCPIRYLEPAFYERPSLQREVITAIEANPGIRAALIPPPHPSIWVAVDGIDNAVRAPLVWAYLEQHFQPDFAQGDVVFWRRK